MLSQHAILANIITSIQVGCRQATKLDPRLAHDLIPAMSFSQSSRTPTPISTNCPQKADSSPVPTPKPTLVTDHVHPCPPSHDQRSSSQPCQFGSCLADQQVVLYTPPVTEHPRHGECSPHDPMQDGSRRRQLSFPFLSGYHGFARRQPVRRSQMQSYLYTLSTTTAIGFRKPIKSKSKSPSSRALPMFWPVARRVIRFLPSHSACATACSTFIGIMPLFFSSELSPHTTSPLLAIL